MNNPDSLPDTAPLNAGRLNLLLAIQKADNAGFSAFAEALRELYSKQYPEQASAAKRAAVKASFSAPPFQD